MAAGSKVGVLLNRLRRTVSPLCLALLVAAAGCAELTGTGSQPEGQPRKEATRPAQQTEESMTPVERATATAEARDRSVPLIVGETGGECDFGYTSVAFATGLRDRLHPGDSLTFTAQILLFNADLNLERTWRVPPTPESCPLSTPCKSEPRPNWDTGPPSSPIRPSPLRGTRRRSRISPRKVQMERKHGGSGNEGCS